MRSSLCPSSSKIHVLAQTVLSEKTLSRLSNSHEALLHEIDSGLSGRNSSAKLAFSRNLGINQRGFTLIEIMVVVVILAILAALVVPQIISRPDEARHVKAVQDIMSIESAMDLYKLDNGQYPTTDQGIAALVTKPTIEPLPQHWRQYLKRLPKDPWDREYHYLNPGEHATIDIFSYGSDGQPGGEGSNKEIGNWDTNRQQ